MKFHLLAPAAWQKIFANFHWRPSGLNAAQKRVELFDAGEADLSRNLFFDGGARPEKGHAGAHDFHGLYGLKQSGFMPVDRSCRKNVAIREIIGRDCGAPAGRLRTIIKTLADGRRPPRYVYHSPLPALYNFRPQDNTLLAMAIPLCSWIRS